MLCALQEKVLRNRQDAEDPWPCGPGRCLDCQALPDRVRYPRSATGREAGSAPSRIRTGAVGLQDVAGRTLPEAVATGATGPGLWLCVEPLARTDPLYREWRARA